ncbi:hypothetical protein [Halorientalis marina]|uniref:hypothetical protein n=1 Tax=Halorientalis marina TaxID=2931976 RepID=UPI001FF4BFB7|nr:hypothetical protein [Halorientalis marina]
MIFHLGQVEKGGDETDAVQDEATSGPGKITGWQRYRGDKTVAVLETLTESFEIYFIG